MLGTEAVVREPDVWPAHYMLKPYEVQWLGESLIYEQGGPEARNEQFGVYCVPGSSRFANLGRTLESEIFAETFGAHDAQFMHKEYGPYDGQDRYYQDTSWFFIAMNHETNEPVGVLRVMQDTTNGLKTLRDLEEITLETRSGQPVHVTQETLKHDYGMQDTISCWDVATVATKKAYRGTQSPVSKALYRALYESSRQLGVQHWVSVIDKAEVNNLNKLGVPFKPIADTKPFTYLGSKAYALHCHVTDVEPSMRAREAEVLATGQSGDHKRRLAVFIAGIIGSVLDGTDVDKLMRFDIRKQPTLI